MSGTKILSVCGQRVWDSRGRPTIEAQVELSNGSVGRAIAPAGASTGSREAVDLRDQGKVLGGFGVKNALRNVNEDIARRLEGLDASNQELIDHALIELDGTKSKSKLGGNATVAVSMANLQATAAAAGIPLWKHLSNSEDVRIPMPEVQIFGGGAHASGRVDIQDFMAVPTGAQTFDHAMEMIAEIYISAGKLMDEAGRLAGVADEGGWWPNFHSNEEALDTLVCAIEHANFKPGDDIAISIDVAASQFGENGKYSLGLDNEELDADGMIDLLGGWIDRYPIVSIEDPLGEDDPDGFKAFTKKFGHRIQIIGDDLLVTNAELITEAAGVGTCNSVLIKPNQAGTVTETKEALQAAQEANWSCVVSARSGETEDTTIAHLAVGWKADQFKVGSFARSERMAKWNEILRIEKSLGTNARLNKT